MTFSVDQATPSVVASDAGGTYNGNPFAATATATGSDGVTPVSGSFTFTYYVGSAVSDSGSSTAPTNAGTYTVVAAFTSSDSNYTNAHSAPVTFTVGQATPSVVVSDAGGTYNGNPFSATATATGVGGASVTGRLEVIYFVGSTVSGTGSLTAPTNAGTYTAVAGFLSGDPNYVAGPTDSAPVTFTIGQATPLVAASDVGGTYNGHPFPATGTATGVRGTSIGGNFAFTYYVGSTVGGSGSSTAPTNAGTYTVVAAFTSTDANYTNATSAPVTFTVGQATPSVVASAPGGIFAGPIYDGNPFPASATATGVGGASVTGTFAFTYYVGSMVSGSGSSTAPTNAGPYTVVASFTSADANYANAQSAPVTFTVDQAIPSVVASDAGGTYSGNPFPATATATGVGGASVSGSFAFTYYVGSTVNGNGSATAPTNAGTYTVVAAFASSDPNYANARSAPVTFAVGQATPVVMASDAGGTYNGNSFPASASAIGVGGTSVSGNFALTYYVGSTVSGSGLSTAPTNAGTYTVVAAFTSADPNYSSAHSASVTFTIGQATPSVVASDAGGTFDGNPFPASATATGVGGLAVTGSVSFTYYVGATVSGQGSSTAPTNAGTYTVAAAFSSADANYTNTQSGLVTFSIGQATPTVFARDVGGTYNGNSFPAIAAAIGISGAHVSGTFTFTYYVGSTVSGTGSSTAPMNAGTYTVVAAFTSADSNYITGPTNGAPVTFTISQATPVVDANDAGGTYDGSPFPASAGATGVGGTSVSGSFAFTYYVGVGVSGPRSSTAPTNAGAYTVVATFSSADTNYANAQSASRIHHRTGDTNRCCERRRWHLQRQFVPSDRDRDRGGRNVSQRHLHVYLLRRQHGRRHWILDGSQERRNVHGRRCFHERGFQLRHRFDHYALLSRSRSARRRPSSSPATRAERTMALPSRPARAQPVSAGLRSAAALPSRITSAARSADPDRQLPRRMRARTPSWRRSAAPIQITAAPRRTRSH